MKVENKAKVKGKWLIVDFDHIISPNDDNYTQPLGMSGANISIVKLLATALGIVIDLVNWVD